MSIELRVWVVSVVVLRPVGQGAEVLLMRRTAPPAGAWCQVAGKIKEGEAGWAAALRELAEETDLIPESFWSADYLERFYEAERDIVTVAPVFVAMVAPGAEPILNTEHDDHCWLPVDAAIDRVSFGGQREMLAWVRGEFIDRVPSPHLRIAVP